MAIQSDDHSSVGFCVAFLIFENPLCLEVYQGCTFTIAVFLSRVDYHHAPAIDVENVIAIHYFSNSIFVV